MSCILFTRVNVPTHYDNIRKGNFLSITQLYRYSLEIILCITDKLESQSLMHSTDRSLLLCFLNNSFQVKFRFKAVDNQVDWNNFFFCKLIAVTHSE